MTNVIKLDNSLSTVKRRENIMAVQHKVEELVASGKAESGIEGRKLTHHFTDVDSDYGCGLYGREMFMPKGTLVVGKIHKRQGLNFLLKGKIYVATEFGKVWYNAPCIIKGEANVKRVVFAAEDSIFVNVHLTKHVGEENLDKIEQDIVATDYSEVGLMDSVHSMLASKGEDHGI